MLTQSFTEDMKRQLLAKKRQLEEDLKGLVPHTEIGDDEDSNAEEVGLDEANRDLILTMRSDLEKIGKALDKIASGTYGTDDQGKEIGEARLRAIPWADKAI